MRLHGMEFGSGQRSVRAGARAKNMSKSKSKSKMKGGEGNLDFTNLSAASSDTYLPTYLSTYLPTYVLQTLGGF